MTFWSPRVDEFCWTKLLTLIKTKRNRKWKIPQTVFERQTLCVSSYKNRKFKVKLWWVGARKRKKWAFFVPFILSEGHFFNICVVYWIHFQNIHTFPYQKHYFVHFCCLFLKPSKAFSASLNDLTPFFLGSRGSRYHDFIVIFLQSSKVFGIFETIILFWSSFNKESRVN